MAIKSKEISYWPHMIMGFLIVGITLGYWTVKSAISVPVQESNEYMLKYQQADININEILEKKALFDKRYTIKLLDTQNIVHEIENSKVAKEQSSIVLNLGMNKFNYAVVTKKNKPVEDANVTFLLTRPHTGKDDFLVNNVSMVNGKYQVNDINISKAGRYTLQLRVKIGDAIGYSQLSAYLKP